jgi:RNA recognition motif-containing protein
MSNKLFVGGLSWDTNDEGLRNAFGQHGTVVEAKVVMDRDTGRSRGFGFVTMSDATATQNAMREMDGSTLDGRAIRVNEANDRGGGGGGGGGGGRPGGFGGGGGDRDRGGGFGGGGGRPGGGGGRNGGGGGGGGRRY